MNRFILILKSMLYNLKEYTIKHFIYEIKNRMDHHDIGSFEKSVVTPFLIIIISFFLWINLGRGLALSDVVYALISKI